MKRDESKWFLIGLSVLLGVGILSAVVVYALYFANFSGSLSEDQGKWGTFGDYVGGVLNPIFGFLAFSGLAVTIWLQVRQLDMLKRQGGLEELQRVLATLSTRIDGMLAATLNTRTEPASLPLFECINIVAQLKVCPPTTYEEWGYYAMTEERMAMISRLVDAYSGALGTELEALARTLGQYAEDGGNRRVLQFYDYRYRGVLVMLEALGLLENRPNIHFVFAPKSNQEALQRSAKKTADELKQKQGSKG